MRNKYVFLSKFTFIQKKKPAPGYTSHGSKDGGEAVTAYDIYDEVDKIVLSIMGPDVAFGIDETNRPSLPTLPPSTVAAERKALKPASETPNSVPSTSDPGNQGLRSRSRSRSPISASTNGRSLVPPRAQRRRLAPELDEEYKLRLSVMAKKGEAYDATTAAMNAQRDYYLLKHDLLMNRGVAEGNVILDDMAVE